MEASDTNVVLSKDLELLGLSSYESKTYLAMLPLGFTEAKALANLVSIPMGRIYDVLSSLEGKGIIDRQDSRPKRYMAKRPKVALETLIDSKNNELDFIKERVSTIEDELSSLYNETEIESQFWSVALDPKSITRLNQKIYETEKELLIYVNFQTYANDLNNHELTETMMDLDYLLKKQVDIKILFGGITNEEFKEFYLEHFLPFHSILKQIEIRFIPLSTNKFEIIDSEKILLKVPNPLQQEEYLAFIFLWQKSFAKKIRSKFFDLWKNGIPLSYSIS